MKNEKSAIRHPPSAIEGGLGWLQSRLNDKGALTLEGDTEPHWTTSLFVLTLTRLGLNDECRRQNDELKTTSLSVHHSSFITHRSVEWLLTWEGRPVTPQKEIAVDSTLIGWPWISGTFSWVEPTSYALLALKMCGLKPPRVAVAEALLVDRVCQDGGWNYGNHTALGAPLVAYVPTSALAALALQDVAAAGEVVNRGLAFLDRELKSHQSALSLALTILCFDVFGRSKGDLAQALCRRQEPDGSWRQQIHVTALAVLALQAVAGGKNVFKL